MSDDTIRSGSPCRSEQVARLTSITAILGITALMIAHYLVVGSPDQIVLTAAIGSIAGLGGYELKRRRDQN